MLTKNLVTHQQRWITQSVGVSQCHRSSLRNVQGSLGQVKSLLKVLSSFTDALDESLSPAFLHGMRELELRDVSDCGVNSLLKRLDVRKPDASHFLLDSCEQKKVRRRQIR